MTVVCGDSHTATHGAFGALAFGIGTSEVEHVLATQCLLQNKPKSLRVEVTGQSGASPLPPGVTAKDLILALIARIGTGGGTGHAIEYAGPAIRALTMEERMTVCNMSIEAGARSGMVAPDEVTFQYLAGRPFAPKGAAWERAVADWRGAGQRRGRRLRPHGDAGRGRPAGHDHLRHQSWHGHAGERPHPRPGRPSATRPSGRRWPRRWPTWTCGPATQLLGHKVDVVFLGSCTNGRLHDLRLAAGMLKGRQRGARRADAGGARVASRSSARPRPRGWTRIFTEAGAEWREPGCSMCIGMNGDNLTPGQYAVSTVQPQL